jgi:hypothetical protein
MNCAETAWLSNTSFEESTDAILLILHAAGNAAPHTSLMHRTGLRLLFVLRSMFGADFQETPKTENNTTISNP